MHKRTHIHTVQCLDFIKQEVERCDDFNLHVGLFGPVFRLIFRGSREMLRPSSPQNTGPVSVLGSERRLCSPVFVFFVREQYKKKKSS